MKPYFPMFVDISEKRAVVIGGGKVAARRVETLLLFTENITVIAPEISEEIDKAVKERKIHWIPLSVQDADEKEILCHADLVFAATNDSVCNERIADMCKEYKIPVNVSHRKELCDFYFPAVVVQDHVVAGITASGLNHGEAKQARIKIEKALKEKGDTEE